MVERMERESPSWQPNVQETRQCALDPQRQHAQLLTVWAQGNKAFRRWQHNRAHDYAPWAEFEPWWNLARKLEEKGLVARMFPAPGPVILVSGGGRRRDAWFALVSDAVLWQDVFKHIVVIHPGQEALLWESGQFTVSMACAARLGAAHWEVLRETAQALEGLQRMVWEPIGVAIEILSLLTQKPPRRIPWDVEDLESLAKLFRHRGQPQQVALKDPGRYVWIKTVPTANGQRYQWPLALGQDEDIVH